MDPLIRELLLRLLLTYGREKISWSDFNRERYKVQKAVIDEGSTLNITSLQACRYIITDSRLEDIQLTDFAVEQLTKGE